MIKNYKNAIRKICERVQGKSDLTISLNQFWGRDKKFYFKIIYDNKGLYCHKLYQINIEKETCKSIEKKLIK